ncbi:MAG: HAD family hydrolase [Phycisphaerae bacterium]
MTSPAWPDHPEAEIPVDVRGLIFDCDGTLVDTMPLHYVAWVKALEHVGIHFPEERFYSFAGAPTRTIIEILAKEQGITCDAEQVAQDKEKLYTDNLQALEPIHSVIEIARREKGKRELAVASGGWRRVVKASLTVVGIEEMFEAIVGADDVVHGKPAPDVFLKAAELLHLKPEECVVYEDGEMGILAAQAAGMRVIDVRPWYLPRRQSTE